MTDVTNAQGAALLKEILADAADGETVLSKEHYRRLHGLMTALATQPPALSQAEGVTPDGYLEHTQIGDFLAYSASTKNRKTPLYSLEKARAVLSQGVAGAEGVREALAAMVEAYDRDQYRSWEKGSPDWSGALKKARAALWHKESGNG